MDEGGMGWAHQDSNLGPTDYEGIDRLLEFSKISDKTKIRKGNRLPRTARSVERAFNDRTAQVWSRVLGPENTGPEKESNMRRALILAAVILVGLAPAMAKKNKANWQAGVFVEKETVKDGTWTDSICCPMYLRA
jgi:hypothetical protein